MNAEEFEKICGFPPDEHDLEITNCQDVGKKGHTACGICPHGVPNVAYTCEVCYPKSPVKDE